MQPSKQKPKVPVLEKHLIDQLSTEEQDSLNMKFQEATDAEKKVDYKCSFKFSYQFLKNVLSNVFSARRYLSETPILLFFPVITAWIMNRTSENKIFGMDVFH